ncbi:MAG: hypothetical protein U0176_22965 [Bacteroidia bacterium]
MKTKHLTIISVILLLAFSGCGWFDPCRNVECGPHGTCNDGICECEAGWQDGNDGYCTDPIPCYGLDCGHGACNPVDEVCDCDPYWEHSADSTCNTLKRDGFLGTWTGNHTEDGTTVGPYTMTIAAGLEIQDILITNFLNESCFGSPLQVTSGINSLDEFSFFTFSCGNYDSGTLRLRRFSATQITLSGAMTRNGNILNITGLYTKQ